MSEAERKKIYVIGDLLINLFKWIVLIYSVLYIGLTIGLIVTIIVYGNSLELATFTNYTNMLLPYTKSDVELFINNYGMTKMIVASLGYSVGLSITDVVLYILLSKFRTFFKNITIGDLFTKKSETLVDELIGISFILTFLMPIMLFILSSTTNIFSDIYASYSYGGLIVLIFVFVVKIIINRGLSIVKENNKFDRTIDDYKADIDELKIQSIKREAELKELKKLVKDTTTTKKTTTTKTTTKTDDIKRRKNHHSRAKKGTTAK